MKYTFTCIERKKEIKILLELNGFTKRELEIQLINILDITDDVVLKSLEIKPMLEKKDLLLDFVSSREDVLLVKCYAIQEDINLLLFTMTNISRGCGLSYLSYKKGSEKNVTLLRKSTDLKVSSTSSKYFDGKVFSKQNYHVGFGNSYKSNYKLIVLDNNYCMAFWYGEVCRKYTVNLCYKAKLVISSEVLEPPSREHLFTFKENELILYRLYYESFICNYHKLSIQCPPAFFENLEHPKTHSNHYFEIVYDGLLQCLSQERTFSKDLKMLERREKCISKVLLNWWNDRKWTVKNHIFSKEFRYFIENLLFIQKFNCNFSKISLDVLQHCIIPFISEIELFINENKPYYCFRKCLNLEKEVGKANYKSYKDFKLNFKRNELKFKSNDFFSMFEGVFVLKELINNFDRKDYSIFENKFDLFFDIILNLLKCLIDSLRFKDQFLKCYMIKKIILQLYQATKKIKYIENLLKDKKRVHRICLFLDNNRKSFFNAVTIVFTEGNHNDSSVLLGVFSTLMSLKFWISTTTTIQFYFNSLLKFLSILTKDFDNDISNNIRSIINKRRNSITKVLKEIFRTTKILTGTSKQNGLHKEAIKSLATELKTIFHVELKFAQYRSSVIFNEIFKCLLCVSLHSKENFEILISKDSFFTDLFFNTRTFIEDENMFRKWIIFVIKRISFKRLNKFLQCENNEQIKHPIIPLLNYLDSLSSSELQVLNIYRIKALNLILMKDDFEMKKDDEVDIIIKQNALLFLKDLRRIENLDNPLNLTGKEKDRILLSFIVINNYINKGYPSFEFCFNILKYLSGFLKLRKDFFLMYRKIIDVIIEIVENFVKKGTFNKKEVDYFSLFQKEYSIMLGASKIIKEFKQVPEISAISLKIKKVMKIEDYYEGLKAIISFENVSKKLQVKKIPKTFEKYLHLVGMIILSKPPKEILYCSASSFINVVNYTYPPYVDESKFKEVNISNIGPLNLPGTITIPIGNEKPLEGVAILVLGSGPGERDESNGFSKIFKDIAGGLSSNNIAVLRYDKRTHWHKIGDNITYVEEYLEDALSACEIMTDMFKLPSVIIGHSLGGRMAPMMVDKAGYNTIGLISMAGPTERSLVGLKRQYEYIWTEGNKTLTPAQKQALVDIQKVEDLLELGDLPDDYNLPSILSHLRPHYLTTFYAYDEVETAKSLTKKMVFINGVRDYQVTIKDNFVNWEKMESKYIVTKRYDNLNHLFTYGEGPCYPEEYSTPAHVQPEVIEDLVNYVKDMYN